VTVTTLVSAYAVTEHFAEIALASSMQNIVFFVNTLCVVFSALTLLVERQEEHLACKN